MRKHLTICVDGSALAEFEKRTLPEDAFRELAIPLGEHEFVFTVSRVTPPTHNSPGFPAEKPELSEIAEVMTAAATWALGWVKR